MQTGTQAPRPTDGVTTSSGRNAPEGLNQPLYIMYNAMIAKVLKWGNSYGIRISKKDAEDRGLKEGDEVVVEVRAREGQTIDLSDLPSFHFGGDLAERHDEAWADAVARDHRDKGRRRDETSDADAEA